MHDPVCISLQLAAFEKYRVPSFCCLWQMLDQLTYVDAAIAEAESFAANMGANYDHHCMVSSFT